MDQLRQRKVKKEGNHTQRDIHVQEYEAHDEFNLNRVKTYATKAQVPYKRDDDSPSFNGAQGVVYKADLSSGLYSKRSFATKEIRLSGPQERTRLENEVKHLRKCDHPNILKLHEAFRIENDRWANTYFLVTEPWAETSFQRFFSELGASKTGKAPTSKWHIPEQVEPWPSIIQQCVLGLQHLHNNLIRHKDLKPENILLLDEANGETEKPTVRVIIADLGISKPSIVDTTSFDGTRQYMAPEQLVPWMRAKQQKTSFFAIDEFAKGGFAPNIDKIMHVLREMHHNQAGEVNPEVEAFRTLLLDIVSKMVEVDPQQRPDADTLCDILETYQERSRPPIKKTFIKLFITSPSRSFQVLIDISTTKTDKELVELLNQHTESARCGIFEPAFKAPQLLQFGVVKLHFTYPISSVNPRMFFSTTLYHKIGHTKHPPSDNERFILEDIEHHLQQYQSVSQTANTAGNHSSNSNTAIVELHAKYELNRTWFLIQLGGVSTLAIVLNWHDFYDTLTSDIMAIIYFSLIINILSLLSLTAVFSYKSLRDRYY
ncbi:hypothetical protein V498_01985 [Pseudogymnoascus sp. VKM F-4517 (FW-2822)]|nr:hypothetical protein V498_01985 [Pseudogymnoascus sp. VKM F-4517 (FW-2822)]